jgi:hypothetical protein
MTVQAYRITTVVPEGKTITLNELPFSPGQAVDVIVLPAVPVVSEKGKYPLRGASIHYENPIVPVAESDWEAMK